MRTADNFITKHHAVDCEFKFEEVNPAYLSILGYSKEEIMLLSVADITDPGDLARDLRLAEKLASAEIPYFKVKTRFNNKAGEVIWVKLIVSALRNRHGVIVEYMGCVDPLSEDEIPNLTIDSMDSV